MKKWNGSGSPSTFIFWRVCFFIGMPVLFLIFLGQMRFDDREGPGWNPLSKMPDGKIGISEDGAASFGFVVMMGGFLLIAALR